MVLVVKNPPARAGDVRDTDGFDPWIWKIPWRRERLLTLVFWHGKFHGLYSPWCWKELDTTEHLSLSLKEVLGSWDFQLKN